MGAQSIRDDHRLALSLLRNLKIVAVEANTQGPGLVYLRGRSRLTTEISRMRLRRPFDYNVAVSMQRGGPSRLLRKARQRAARSQTVAPGLGQRLSDLLSAEEVAYLSDRSGYSFWETSVDADAVLDWAASNLIRGGHQLLEPQGGMSGVIDALATAARSSGVEIFTGHPVRSLTYDAAGMPELGFGPLRPPLSADSVILALPRLPVSGMEGFGRLEPVLRLVAAVEPWPVVTSAILYPDCWWTLAGIRSGIATTDSPLGLLRHFGAEAVRDGHRMGALAMFADGAKGTFWREGISDLAQGEWLPSGHPAREKIERMVEMIYMPKLGHSPPPVGEVMIHDWMAPPFGAAFHLWATGTDPAEAAVSALKPISDAAIHICGEAWSPRQAWMEGALETVEQLLGRHFNVPPPLTKHPSCSGL